MRSIITSLVFALRAASFALSSPTPQHGIAETKHQFPNETWVENLAVRSNGNILVTLLSSPEVWQIDPVHGTAELVHHFPQALSVLGITELQPDVFIVAVGNITLPAIASVPGSYSAWKIDMQHHQKKEHARNPPIVSKIADIPQAHFLNGISNFPNHPNTILLADSAQGLIYALDTAIGTSRTYLDNPAFKPNSSIPVKSGINGLHVHEEFLYFTNTFATPALARIPIDKTSGEPIGPVETIVGEPSWEVNIGDQADDFTFDCNGNVWLATDPSNSIVKVGIPGGKTTVEVGGAENPVVAGVTAVAFGRTRRDQDVLYATTNGGIAFPPMGGVVGGKVVAIDTGRLGSRWE